MLSSWSDAVSGPAGEGACGGVVISPGSGGLPCHLGVVSSFSVLLTVMEETQDLPRLRDALHWGEAIEFRGERVGVAREQLERPPSGWRWRYELEHADGHRDPR